MGGLTPDQIQDLLGKRRKKGLYEDRMVELMESDELGVNPAETWPVDFSKKSATTMYQGFRNAATKLEISDDIEVIQRDGAVFLLVKSRCENLITNDESNDDEESADEADSDSEVLVTTMNGDGPVESE